MKSKVFAFGLTLAMSAPVWATDTDGASADAALIAAGVAVDVKKSSNVAVQDGDVDDNTLATGLLGLIKSGDNSISDSYNHTNGVSQNAQNSGIQSLIQQNAGIQANSNGDGGASADASGLALAVAVDYDKAVNLAAQVGDVNDNVLLAGLIGGVSTGDNSISGSFNCINGVTQNAQNSGVQSLIQQQVAIQAN